MANLTERNYVGDVVKYEAENRYSRDVITVASGQGVLKLGTVLAALTASGKFVVAAATGADGSQTAKAVLLEDIDATAADVKTVGLGRHATVSRAGLIYGATINDATKRAAAEAQLAAVGILVREGA